MSNVASTHPDYDRVAPAWELCRDISGGSRAVKAKRTVYLPQPSGMSNADYDAYLKRAVFFNAMARTITALAGAVVVKQPEVEGVPPLVAPDLEDVTLRDESLEDVALEVVQEVLRVGRFGILLDMPEASARPRPYWCLRRAEDIVNWRTERIGDDPAQLVSLVLREDQEVPSLDGFGHEVRPAYRELSLAAGDGGPVAQSRLWTQSDPMLVVSQSATPWSPGPWHSLLRRGTPLSFLPFCFVGPSGITPDVAKPPLEDMAEIVAGHFRNSADHEHGLFLTALPTPWAAGVQGDDQVLTIGPSRAWRLSENGKVGMMEFSGAGLAAVREAMAAKEKMMGHLGGKLLLEEPSAQGPETATSARLRYSAESASLRTIAASVSAALTRILRWHCWWVGLDDGVPLDVEVRLASSFFDVKASSEEVKTAVFAVQAGEISSETFYSILTRGGWSRPGVTFEQERQAIERQVNRLLPVEGGNDAA
jgi:hypothetical protein